MPSNSNAKSKNVRTSKTYSFTLILMGPSPLEEANLNALFDAACDDATFGQRDGVYFADFDRVARSFSKALASAINDVESAVAGLRVVRVEPEELVTASEIAARLHRTRESIRLLFESQRGAGDFPRPVAWLENGTRLWYWHDIFAWAAQRSEFKALAGSAHEAARSIHTANAFLALRAEAGIEDASTRALFASLISPEPRLRRLLGKTP